MRCHAMNACEARVLRRDPQAGRSVTPRDAALGASAKETLPDRTRLCFTVEQKEGEGKPQKQKRKSVRARQRVLKRGKDTGEVRRLELYSSRHEREAGRSRSDQSQPGTSFERWNQEELNLLRDPLERSPCFLNIMRRTQNARLVS